MSKLPVPQRTCVVLVVIVVFVVVPVSGTPVDPVRIVRGAYLSDIFDSVLPLYHRKYLVGPLQNATFLENKFFIPYVSQ